MAYYLSASLSKVKDIKFGVKGKYLIYTFYIDCSLDGISKPRFYLIVWSGFVVNLVIGLLFTSLGWFLLGKDGIIAGIVSLGHFIYSMLLTDGRLRFDQIVRSVN